MNKEMKGNELLKEKGRISIKESPVIIKILETENLRGDSGKNENIQ